MRASFQSLGMVDVFRDMLKIMLRIVTIGAPPSFNSWSLKLSGPGAVSMPMSFIASRVLISGISHSSCSGRSIPLLKWLPLGIGKRELLSRLYCWYGFVKADWYCSESRLAISLGSLISWFCLFISGPIVSCVFFLLRANC